MGSTDRVLMGCNETAKEDRNKNRCIIEGGGKIGRGRSWDRGRGTDPASLLRRRRRKVSGGREGGENESGPRFWTHTSPPPPFFERDIHSILPLCSIQLRPRRIKSQVGKNKGERDCSALKGAISRFYSKEDDGENQSCAKVSDREKVKGLRGKDREWRNFLRRRPPPHPEAAASPPPHMQGERAKRKKV